MIPGVADGCPTGNNAEYRQMEGSETVGHEKSDASVFGQSGSPHEQRARVSAFTSLPHR